MEIVKRFVLDDILKTIRDEDGSRELTFYFYNADDLSSLFPQLPKNYNQSGSSYQVVRFADDFCIHITLCDHHIQMHEPVEFWLTMEHDAWKDTITLLLASYPAIETDWNLDAYKHNIKNYLSMFHVYNMSLLLLNHYIIKDVFDYLNHTYKRHLHFRETK